MAPIQNTFSIIPNAPSAINGIGDTASSRPVRPPMTTKQVKKAYQKSNKGPKLSKAEQRRRDLFEQDRIRKEFEKEKNQARARAARDKKKEKEERERAEKKKKGLPLVDVRPSQDTIARFIRGKPKTQGDNSASELANIDGNGSSGDKWTLSAEKECVEPLETQQQTNYTDKENIPPIVTKRQLTPGPVTAGDEGASGCKLSVINHAEPPSKKYRVEVSEKGYESPPLAISAVASSSMPKPDSIVAAAEEHREGSPRSSAKQGGPNVYDSFSTIDFGEESLLDDLIHEADYIYGSQHSSDKRKPERQQDRNRPAELPPPKPPESYALSSEEAEKPLLSIERVGTPTEVVLPNYRPLEEIFASELGVNMAKKPRPCAISKQEKQVLTSNSVTNPPPASDTRKSQPSAPSSRSFRYPRTPMAPPPIPPKFKYPNTISAGQYRAPPFLKSPLPSARHAAKGAQQPHIAKAKQYREEHLPPSTQLFMLNHLDDFLPSPSQEVREIFEESPGKSQQQGSQTSSFGTSDSHTVSKPNTIAPNVHTTLCHDNAVATPNIKLENVGQIQQTSKHIEPQRTAAQPFLQPTAQDTLNAFDMPFFSTQDFLLSSQDVKDIEEEPLPVVKLQTATSTALSKDSSTPLKSRCRSPKPFFTSTSREMRYKYAIERSKTTMWEGGGAQQRAPEDLDRLQGLKKERFNTCPAYVDAEEKKKSGKTVDRSHVVEYNVTVKRIATTQSHSMHTPASHPSQPNFSNIARQENVPSSDSIAQKSVGKSSQNPPGAQKQKPSSSTKSQRNARPKSSYEAMLELLAHGSTQNKPQQRPGVYKAKESGKHIERQERNEEQAMTIPASQETDYDCGEDWDDDDLLRDIL
ncbi:hypothetical protein F5Y19DRAFT_261918 [Xylariaceae sp. FL1651]|nr:hypothetical protein F5Y19DRAFT_261918 [Xylariaceae sp. FL1651]